MHLFYWFKKIGYEKFLYTIKYKGSFFFLSLFIAFNILHGTRMHSTRMRTARLCIVGGGGGRCCDQVRGGGGGGRCCDQVWGGGGEVLWPGPGWGGGREGGAVQRPLVLHSSPPPPPRWTEWMTHACKNITFARFAKRAVKIQTFFSFLSFWIFMT